MTDLIKEFGILQRSDPRLRERSFPVDFQGDTSLTKDVCARLKDVVAKLRENYPSPRGGGCSAPQIGAFLRIVCLMMPGDAEPRIFINPRITGQSPEQTLDYEGCLSLFEYRGRVWRPDWMTIEFQDLAGAEHKETLKDAFCRLMDHEIDHLNGVLYDTKVLPPETLMPVDEYVARKNASSLPLPTRSLG